MTARLTRRNTTEIRVNDSSRQKIEEGLLIRFRCQDDQVLTGITRVTHYADVFAHE
jgi:ASC-1-like (ASCH) protein